MTRGAGPAGQAGPRRGAGHEAHQTPAHQQGSCFIYIYHAVIFCNLIFGVPLPGPSFRVFETLVITESQAKKIV